jgi:hypothetical protein
LEQRAELPTDFSMGAQFLEACSEYDKQLKLQSEKMFDMEKQSRLINLREVMLTSDGEESKHVTFQQHNFDKLNILRE